MANMKFKGWEWPHNPSTFVMNYEIRLVKHEFPGVWGAETEDLGLGPRSFSGSGAFYGPSAWRHFSKLADPLWNTSVGILEHPRYGKFNARLVKITSKEEPLPNYVEYDFEFIEHKEITAFTKITAPSATTPTTPVSSARYYVVVRGDNLWNISKKYYGKGSSWPTIANANKSLIKNPNLIYPGWRLLIP
jgi:LysM repeat protein